MHPTLFNGNIAVKMFAFQPFALKNLQFKHLFKITMTLWLSMYELFLFKAFSSFTISLFRRANKEVQIALSVDTQYTCHKSTTESNEKEKEFA